MHGQDIPWLLEHWADAQARPSRPWSGTRPTASDAAGPTRELLADTQRLAAGLARPRHRAAATRCSSTPRTAPRCCSRGWPARRSARSPSPPTRGRSPAEVAYFAEHTQCVAAITAARSSSAHVAECGDRLQWVAIDRRPARPTRRRDRTFDDARAATPASWTGRADRTAAAVRDHVHVGHDEQAEGRRAHARQRGLGQPHRPAQHRPRHRRPLPDLPPALPRERAELVVLLGARRRRDRGAHAEVVDEPLLGRRRRATTSRTSR